MNDDEPRDQDGGGEEHAVPVGQVTLLLRQMQGGDREAFDRVVPLIYDELRRVARAQLRRVAPGRTLDTTGLVHEAYLKMAGQQGLEVESRRHFLAVSAHAMRQILVDYARARLAAKRGGGEVRVTLEEQTAVTEAEAGRLLDIDRALEGLRAESERMAKIVECRYFAGLTEEETAEALDTSLRTVQREWKRARAWLREALGEAG
ncbi:MAG TPA: sigma-70 family RNA polymerase sigma factor [Thermoanaerobaculia bacterium]|nr:sigma-70 family RNA polymerase sigma factor [Thermoanaerobaculia bacterium]